MTFEPPNIPSFYFVGTLEKPSIPIIKAMKASQMINKGCMAYVTSIIEIPKFYLSFEHIPVV